jgi:hypothetical protein
LGPSEFARKHKLVGELCRKWGVSIILPPQAFDGTIHTVRVAQDGALEK